MSCMPASTLNQDTLDVERVFAKPSVSPVTSSEADLPPAEVDVLSEDMVFVAASPAMREVRKQVRQVANIDIPVLLLGESGTGKEVIAHLIHKSSYRAHRTFMKVNCAALPSELLESELFGHEAGAFTGATRSKPGKFEICHNGTILLDEIAEMPIGPQAKLLHVLQDGEFARLGSPSPTRVNVRIIAATNVDIQQAIGTGKFRKDLYFRLSAYTIYLPPLRERKEDIIELIKHLLGYWARRYGRPALPVSAALLEACLHYPWPGNVRELENLVKRYLIAGDEAQILSQLKANGNGSNGIGIAPLNKLPGNGFSIVPSDLKSQVRLLKQSAEKEAIMRALELTNGSRKEAARVLGISLRALQYKIRDSGFEGRGSPDVSAG